MQIHTNSLTEKVQKICPDNCNSPKQGKCNTKTGVCKCNEPYYGEKCDSKLITILNSRIVERNSR